jgi:DNA-binding winged helix-turn-helix (wHTH) protein/TolB-like protein/tetratricopeptide (TPR) repeat protein
MNRRALHFYEFGPFRLNATERLLLRDFEVVPLTPKVFDLLLVLVENTGHVLEKTDLMEHLWPDSFVEESSLTQNISLLRRALAEGGVENNYIETIPKRGYRFVAAVREIDETSPESVPESAEPRSGSSRSSATYVMVFSGCIALAIVVTLVYWFRQRHQTENFTPKSVAVLPFKTIGAEQQDLLGLGMADALIIKLSRLEQLTVLPTSSVFRFTNRDKSAVEIGRELGVEGVLDGTVQRDGDWVRVTAQLIRLRDGKTVWSGKFDERYSSIFTLQDSISDQVSSSLRPQMSDSGKWSASHPTENTEAYEAYLTGFYFWNRRTKENLPKAITYLEQAVQKDPNFAEARAILADCYYLSIQEEYGSSPPQEALRRADDSASRALELNENLAEAYTVKAGLKLTQRNYEEAGRTFQRALELKPNYAVAHLRYAYFLYWSMRLDEAVYHMRQAQRLDPVSAITNGALAAMLYSARDFDSSIAYSKRALELEPETVAAQLNLGEAYIQKRMFNEAHEAFDKARDLSPRYVAWEKAYTYALAGQREEAERMLGEAEKLSPRRIHFNYALVYGAMGELDKAFEELEKVMLNPSMAAAIRFDPQFDPMRADPRFKDYLKRHEIEK